jgi:hypothetical protein
MHSFSGILSVSNKIGVTLFSNDKFAYGFAPIHLPQIICTLPTIFFLQNSFNQYSKFLQEEKSDRYL